MTSSKGSSSGSALISGGAGTPRNSSLLGWSAWWEGGATAEKEFFESISYRILDPKHSDDLSLNHFKTSSCPFKLDFRGHKTATVCPPVHKGSRVRRNELTRIPLLFHVFRILPLKHSPGHKALYLTLCPSLIPKLPATVTLQRNGF